GEEDRDLLVALLAPRADVDLAEAGLELHLAPARLGDHACRLGGALEIARINRVRRRALDPLREPQRLRTAELVQGRAGLALKHAAGVVGGLAVPGEDEEMS